MPLCIIIYLRTNLPSRQIRKGEQRAMTCIQGDASVACIALDRPVRIATTENLAIAKARSSQVLTLLPRSAFTFQWEIMLKDSFWDIFSRRVSHEILRRYSRRSAVGVFELYFSSSDQTGTAMTASKWRGFPLS